MTHYSASGLLLVNIADETRSIFVQLASSGQILHHSDFIKTWKSTQFLTAVGFEPTPFRTRA
jgi:hypothetical protein